MDAKHFRVSTLFILCTSQKIHKKLEINFFPQHANELNMPNILKYASNRINSFIYHNELYYIVESIILKCYIVETFQQNSSLQNMVLGLPQLENSFVGFYVYGVIYSPKVKIFSK